MQDVILPITGPSLCGLEFLLQGGLASYWGVKSVQGRQASTCQAPEPQPFPPLSTRFLTVVSVFRLQKGRVQVPLRMSPFYCLGSLSHQGARGGLALSFVTLEAEWGQSWSLCPGLSRLCNVLKRKASVFSLSFVFIVLLINFPGSHWTPESFCLGLRSSWTWKCALPVSLLRETSFITLPYLY